MAQRKNNRRHQKKQTKALSLHERAIHAKNALDHGHYKKAIVHLKQMLKADPKEEWRTWAYTAHVQLALQLSQHNKHHEVITLYESGHKLCGVSLHDLVYIRALLHERHYKKILDCYGELRNSLDKSELFNLRAELAAIALAGKKAGEKEVIELLPEDDPVVVDYDNALQLLVDYCNANDEAVSVGLKTISFRSPYRDLRQIIAAAILLDENANKSVNENINKSKELLSKVSEDSAFSALVAPIKLISEGTQRVIPSLSSLPVVSQQLIKEIKGWHDEKNTKKENNKLLKQLCSLKAEPDFATLFRIADNFKAIQPEFFREVAKIATLHSLPNRNRVITQKRFSQRFGSLDPVSMNHMKALTATAMLEAGELNDSFDPFDFLYDLEHFWLDYINSLDEKHANTPLISALVCRYIVAVKDKYSRQFSEDHIELLERSLRNDPEDQGTHLRLLRYYLENKNLKQARTGLTVALKYYADDLALLLIAIEIAIASGAYKKAAKYAKTILDVDPINRQAQSLLCNAHLSHARKLIKSSKWHLLDKELQEAEHWANQDAVMLSTIALHKAVKAQKNKQKNQAKEEMQKLVSLMPTSLSACFLIRLESLLVNTDAKVLHQFAKLKWMPAKRQPKEVLFSLIEFCKTSATAYEASTISEVLDDLGPCLETIVKKHITLEEYEQILEYWFQTDQELLVDEFVEAAIKKHGEHPVLTYYRYVYTYYLSNDKLDEISDAIELAKDQGDTLTASRLIGVFNKAPPPMSSPFEMSDDEMDAFFNSGLDESEFSEEDDDGELASIPPFILDELKHGDLDDVLSLFGSILGAPVEELKLIRRDMGDEGLRELLLLVVGGASLEDVVYQMESKMRKDTAKSIKNKPKKSTSAKKEIEFDPKKITLFGDDF